MAHVMGPGLLDSASTPKLSGVWWGMREYCPCIIPVWELWETLQNQWEWNMKGRD